jgi:hypothetical protein
MLIAGGLSPIVSTRQPWLTTRGSPASALPPRASRPSLGCTRSAADPSTRLVFRRMAQIPRLARSDQPAAARPVTAHRPGRDDWSPPLARSLVPRASAVERLLELPPSQRPVRRAAEPLVLRMRHERPAAEVAHPLRPRLPRPPREVPNRLQRPRRTRQRTPTMLPRFRQETTPTRADPLSHGCVPQFESAAKSRRGEKGLGGVSALHGKPVSDPPPALCGRDGRTRRHMEHVPIPRISIPYRFGPPGGP